MYSENMHDFIFINLPGNGNSLIDMDSELSVIITGDSVHFSYTFKMKYPDRSTTTKNIIMKKILKTSNSKFKTYFLTI